jgi:hypothetical protein
MFQSIAICRFLAKQVGLSGDNEEEDYEIDNAVDTIDELRAGELNFQKRSKKV